MSADWLASQMSNTADIAPLVLCAGTPATFPFFVYVFVAMQFQPAAYSSPDISIEATIGSTLFSDKVNIFSLCHFTESVDMNIADHT